MPRVLSAIKNMFVPAGYSPRTVRGGLLRGLRFNVDLRYDTQLWLGLAETELAPWFRKLSKNTETAIDVGASQGYYSLYWLAKTRVKRVLAFEPDQECINRFNLNLQLNKLHCSRVEVIEKCVGPHSTSTHCSLDEFLPKIEGPTLVKMDIEGWEGEALRGAQKLIKRRDVSWIIETHSKGLETECRETFEREGYCVRSVPRALFRAVLPELRPAEYNSWLLATRDEI